MSKVIEKLEVIAKYSDGIFISGQPLSGQKELNYFNNFSKRNPHYFSVIDIQRTKIIQLTQFFNNDYISPKKINMTRKAEDILQRVLWTGLILHEVNPSNLPIHTFRWGKHFFILDNMSNSTEYFINLKKEINFHGVVTITPRIKFFNSLDIWSITPILCQKKWVKKHLNFYYHKNFSEITPVNELNHNKKASPNNQSNIFERFISGGIWPQSENECHEDRKNYPGIKNPLTGFEKWIMDKSILNNGNEVPENYYFGIYP